MTHPDLENVPPFYKGYVDHVKDLDMLFAIRNSGERTATLIKSIPEEKGEYRYQPQKWSIKEMICHLMDVERILAYRALRFARHDKTPLPGFEENDYAPEANAHARTIKQLVNEMTRLRATTLDLFESFTPAMLQRKGISNNSELSVINIGYIVAGHESHHWAVLNERYLKA